MREMKDSGIEWIGEIPKEWETTKMKYIGKYINGYAFNPSDWTSKGKPIIRIQDLTGSNDNPNYYEGEIDSKYSITKGDILVSWAATLDAYIWNKNDGLLNQHIFKAIPNEIVEKSFFFWLIKEAMTNMNNDNKHGIVMQHVTLDVFNNFGIPLPPLEEQQKLSTYLNDKCTKIDSIIEKQEKVIEKLKDYKLSRINEIVTNVDGIECNLGRISSMKNGLNFNITLEGNKVKFLGVGDFKDYFVLNEKEMFSEIIITEEIPQEYLLENGDIVFVRSNGSKELVGRAVMVENIDFALTYSGFCIRFRNTRADLIDDKYLLYFFRSPYFRKQLERYSQGSNINNINQVLLSKISIIIPSPNYQIAALETLDKLSSSIDSIITKKQVLIEKLTEYKKSLIYEVVTGKKEV